MVTLEGLGFESYHSIQAWFPFKFGCSKKNQYTHCKTMFTCWVSLFCNGFTLGPMAQATPVKTKQPKKQKKGKKGYV